MVKIFYKKPQFCLNSSGFRKDHPESVPKTFQTKRRISSNGKKKNAGFKINSTFRFAERKCFS
ncbi:hypothetical protein LEP1GSC060_0472 [Leptospira weilii serovar Ranarum str. ICFT]|uniref:Uncharacterized protein n=1 Tax=Leptospira weilii serovar Ranarum str. ICFT TaxID=1218598 RepID=N1WV37_9LEPT|nr:hypothetical protein LEP1GSC060_0472 [Leptospira weilii serovar Ranarum str. ICFT]